MTAGIWTTQVLQSSGAMNCARCTVAFSPDGNALLVGNSGAAADAGSTGVMRLVLVSSLLDNPGP